MSDTFDHEGDAWDSMPDPFDHGDGYWSGGYSLRRGGRPVYQRPLCRECKSTCDWKEWNGRWVLFEFGEPHKCDISNQFEDCSS
jgi:hypothetical protein